jgi:hypothetical protein
LTAAIEAQANQGAGVTIALIDTGVAAKNPEVAGRVSSLSSCAAVTFVCSSGYNDDNGHGTATAAIAAGQYNSNDLMSGVAPAATILEEKVLNASGSGYDSDVANGIMKAAKAGAPVISISITYIPSQTVINAINYATNAGSVIVWAGGNSSAPLNGGSDTTGLSTQALSHIIFVGSVDANNVRSSFSNTPGGGSAASGSTSATYASLWLMAPGENIIAPGIQYGANAYAYWTGTSMSTPEVAGAIALLEATWPVLKTNGTTASVLLASATDLGAAGVDSTYGEGLLNLTKAFQPIGALSVASVGGKLIAVSQGAGGAVTSGALGALPAIRTLLSNYTTFDSFQRNFSVNLSGLITSRSALPQVVAAQTAPINATTQALANGGRLTVAFSHLADDYGLANSAPGLLLSNPTAGPPEDSAFFLSMTSRSGSGISVGRGLPSTASFANAMWGENSLRAYQADQLGVSNALLGLAQGGYFASVGANLTSRARLAATWSSTVTPSSWSLTPRDSLAQSFAVAVGFTYSLASRIAIGAVFSSLAERNGFLGSTYDINGPLNLGAEHRSSSVAVSWTYDLGGNRSLLLDGMIAKTSGATINSGLVASISPVVERAYGVSFTQADAFRDGDRLTLSIVKPLKIISGSAQVLITMVDDQGRPITNLVSAGLNPDGDETDFGVGYSVSLTGGASLSTGMAFQGDAYNVRGLNGVLTKVAFHKSF